MKTFADFNIDIGTKSGTEIKVLCPQCSASRKKKNFPCLNVNTQEGLWNCWHCGWSGTLKGGEWKRPEIIKAYTKPAFIKAKPVDAVTEWFKSRGISAEVIERNGIGKGVAYFPQTEMEMACITFPYFRGEEVINIKYRTREKYFRMAAGAERVLYGLNDIKETVIVVEGEIDKLSVEMAGHKSCVSVPDGAPAPDTKNYSSKFDYLQDKALEVVKTFIIAVDNDAPGVRLQEELVRRLGREKCLMVTWPDGCKDANDVLVKLGPDRLDEALGNAQPMPIAGTYQVTDLMDQLHKEYLYGSPKGIDTGWTALRGLYSVMSGEWTLVTGIPGHGKSEWLDALTLNLANSFGWTFGVFSPENQPLTFHVQKLAEKFIGKPFGEGPTERMSASEFNQAMQWINEHFTFISPELPTLEVLLQIAAELVLRRGIRGLIIDPWNEIDHSRTGNLTETEHISRCLSKVRTFAHCHGVHVWLVAHPTKIPKGVDGNYPVPTPYDVAGSAHWRNKADNCVTVYRNAIDDSAEVQIHIQKVRKKMNGRVGMATLSYDKVNGRYKDVSAVMPKHFASVRGLK